MKILVDTIYTQDPSRCASAYKMRKVVSHLLETIPDAFFYWRIPKGLSDAKKKWLPESTRIMYLEREFFVDRHKEYHYVREEWNNDLMFRGKFWDIDLVLTNRSTLVSLMRAQMYRPGHRTLEWSRTIVVFEDMPVMTFKPSIPIGHEESQDVLTISGYMASDAVAISSYWERKCILDTAKRYFSIASVKKLSERLHEASIITVDKVYFKSREFILDKSKPFTIGFAGRMILGHDFDSIFAIMEKHWIYRAGYDRPVECVISTISKSTARVDVPSFVSLRRLGREDFWDMMKNVVHVGIVMSRTEGMSLSVLEPLLLGTPYVIKREVWSVSSFGEDYPFLVSNWKEGYDIIRRFYNDYATEYKKFVEWSRSKFLPLLLERNKVTHMSVVDTVLKTYRGNLERHHNKVRANNKDLYGLLLDRANTLPEVNLQEVFNDLEREGVVDHLGSKMRNNESKNLSFSTNFNEFRLALGAYGYKDASTEPGHLIKVGD